MTSADIYAYLTTLAVVVVAVFICWTLFYCILILKRIYRMFDAIDDRLKCWSDGWESLLHRFATMRDSLQLIAQGIKAAGTVYQKYSKKPSRSSKAKSEDNGV